MAYNKKHIRERSLRKLKYRLKIAKESNDGNDILKLKHQIDRNIQEFGDSH